MPDSGDKGKGKSLKRKLSRDSVTREARRLVRRQGAPKSGMARTQLDVKVCCGHHIGECNRKAKVDVTKSRGAKPSQ